MKYILLRLFFYFIFFALPLIFYFSFNTECEISSGGLKDPISSLCANDILLYLGTVISFFLLFTLVGAGVPLLIYIPLVLLLVEFIVILIRENLGHNKSIKERPQEKNNAD
jgi:hypothetical protein